MRSRAAHAAELLPELRTALAARTALEWEEIFGERVPCAAVRPIEDMFDHSQVAAEGLVTTLDHPVVGQYRTMTKPIKFSDTPGPAPVTSPTFGQHSDEGPCRTRLLRRRDRLAARPRRSALNRYDGGSARL
jgi:crotonobetainyl-CoA:carnitine CoA-transferase CaiB-like acyl-CoA transferase